ncbi:MAG: PA14 domain-containing protein [Verrucomicrobiota bacterium]
MNTTPRFQPRLLRHLRFVFASLALLGATTAALAQTKSPTVTIVPNTPQTVKVGQPITFTSTATDADSSMEAHHLDWRDPDGRWKWQGTATGLVLSENSEKWFGPSASSSRSVVVTPERAGVFQVRFSALDGGNWTESTIIDVTVTDGNTAAATASVTISPTETQTVAVNQPVTFSSVATSATADITAHNFDWADTSGRWIWDAGADAAALQLNTEREVSFTPRATHSRTITITPKKPGTYKIRFALQRNGSADWTTGQEVQLVVNPRGNAGGGRNAGVNAQYYKGTDLRNFAGNATVPNIDFTWGTGGPIPAVGGDNFSVRWTGFIEATEAGGNYQFTTRTDDGVRLWVDGKLIVDDWKNHSVTERTGAAALTAGQRVAFVMEYYEADASATAQLLWQPPGQANKSVIPPQRFYRAASPSSAAIPATDNGARSTAFDGTRGSR